MLIYVSDRNKGKTMALIKESSKTKKIIVEPTKKAVEYVKEMAKRFELDIPEPISVTEYIQRLARLAKGENLGIQKYLIDELQSVLSWMNIEMAIVDCKSVKDFSSLIWFWNGSSRTKQKENHDCYIEDDTIKCDL